MFLDFGDNSTPSRHETDLCVVGSGVIGLAIASHFLAHRSIRVLVVEHGARHDDPVAAEVPPERSNGDTASGVAGSRAQGFGGSSLRWAGQALPFCPTDFGRRDFLTASGWPLSLDELDPQFERARRYLQLDATPFGADLWQNEPWRAMFAEPQPLSLNFSKFSPQPNLAEVYDEAVATASHLHCLIDAKVVALELAEGGDAVSGLRLRSAGGREGQVHARQVVLCAGGIDNPRLLLASRDHHPAGIGNEHDLVGRYYQDHIGFYGARIEPIDRRAFRRLFATFLKGNQKFVPKLQLSERQQQERQLLNVTGNLGIQEDESAPRESARRVYNDLRRMYLGRRTAADLLRLVRAAPRAARILGSHVFSRRIHIPADARIFLIANAECEPLADSRIGLAEERDSYGMPRAEVHWIFNDRSREAMQAYFTAVQEALESAGIGRVHRSPLLEQPGDEWKKDAYSLYHHMGATRMAMDPRHGVVDADGRVFSQRNLYVAGSSVFPTGSASNPTYTALALAFRLADHLQTRLAS